MKKFQAIHILKLLLLVMILTGCGSTTATSMESGVLKTGKTYLGVQTTDEIIKVDSAEEWTITYQDKDPGTYSVVTVKNTGENIGKYPIYEVVAKEIVGKSSPFVKKTGKKYIISEDQEGLYFIVVNEKTMEEHKKEIEGSNDPHAYIKKHSIYRFVNNG